MNKLLILINFFYQTIQCSFLDNNLNNNLSFLAGGSAVYDFDKVFIGVSVQSNGYLNNIFFVGGDVFSKIYNRNVNVSILGNIFYKNSDAKWSFNALCEIPELLNGLYVGFSINRLEDYNFSFKFAYNKKVYTKKRFSIYVKGSGNIKVFETDYRKQDLIKNQWIEYIQLMDKNYIERIQLIDKIYAKRIKLIIDNDNDRSELLKEFFEIGQFVDYSKEMNDFLCKKSQKEKRIKEMIEVGKIIKTLKNILSYGLSYGSIEVKYKIKSLIPKVKESDSYDHSNSDWDELSVIEESDSYISLDHSNDWDELSVIKEK